MYQEMIGHKETGKKRIVKQAMSTYGNEFTHLCSPYSKSRVLLISATLSELHSGCVEAADVAGIKRSTTREGVRRGYNIGDGILDFLKLKRFKFSLTYGYIMITYSRIKSDRVYKSPIKNISNILRRFFHTMTISGAFGQDLADAQQVSRMGAVSVGHSSDAQDTADSHGMK